MVVVECGGGGVDGGVGGVGSEVATAVAVVAMPAR